MEPLSPLLQSGQRFPTTIRKQNVTLKEVIGTGAYSTVYLGIASGLIGPNARDVANPDRSGETKVAVKVFKGKLSTREDCLAEVMNMTKLNHPHILRILGVVERPRGLPWVILEYMPNGTVYDAIRSGRIPFQETVILRMMTEIACGMNYLHYTHDLVHGDLHSQNCFLDLSGSIKIGDFGFCSKGARCGIEEPYKGISSQKYRAALIQYYKKQYLSSSVLKRYWLPPEYILTQKNDDLVTHKPGDVWAYATLAFQIWTNGELPYGRLNGKQIVEALTWGADPFTSTPISAPVAVLMLLLGCWELEPNTRPTFKDIITTLTENFSCLSLPEKHEIKNCSC